MTKAGQGTVHRPARLPAALLRAWAVGLALALAAPAAAAQDEGLEARLERLERRLGTVEQQSVSDPGAAIYRAACATCHGFDGDGRGPGAEGFAQHATDFTKGSYKLLSVWGPRPMPGDLARTIREGMSGTEMVPFGGLLSERSIAAVARYIRTFDAEHEDPFALPDPRDVVELPAERPFERTAETVAAGAELYEELGCVDCHGPRGEGSDAEEDDWGFPVVMVSFQEGYYKSGRSDRDLFRTIATGMAGTTMEGYLGDADEEEIWQLVDFIRSLAREERQGFFGRLWAFLFSERPSGLDYRGYR